jgi:uncharacterized protein (UPF0179 family)
VVVVVGDHQAANRSAFMSSSEKPQVNLQKTKEFCAARGLYGGYRYRAMVRGRVRDCVFSRIGGTGWMICHEVGEPDMQSSWAVSPEEFVKDLEAAK